MKKIILQTFFICIFAHLQIFSFSQSRLRISLLTCTPGADLNETFGHSAFRVIDSNSVTDHVYNYGTFPFYEKGFYVNFVRGKLKYSVEIEQFEDFKQNYLFQNRGITEQVLQLTDSEKVTVYHSLLENIKEENKYYQYDFFLDNCTTRLRDIIKKHHQPKPELPAVMPTNYTFRNAIHQYLDSNDKAWGKLGIDLLLGARTDAVMTTEQHEFLPDNLMRAFDSTKNTSLVLSSNQLYSFTLIKIEKQFFTPFVLTFSILLFFVFLSLIKNKKVKKFLNILDATLFFTVGVLGILFIFMWFGTDHIMTKNNYNLLWASPLFILYAFFINRNTAKAKNVSLFVFVYLLLVLCSWFFLPQLMNNALLPIVVLLAWRSSRINMHKESLFVK